MKRVDLSIADFMDDSGMTFIEILVVLAIIAFAMATMMPSIRVTRHLGVATYASEIAAELRVVRASAIRSSQVSKFHFDAQNRAIFSDANTKSRSLPPGVDASLQAARSYVRDASDAAIVFFPDGSSTGGELTLKSATTAVTILIDWLSGRVDVEEGAL